MVLKVKTHEAKTQFSKLLKHAVAGEEVVVYRGDHPIVRLVPIRDTDAIPHRPSVGCITSEPVQYSEDAFAPLSEDDLEEWGL